MVCRAQTREGGRGHQGELPGPEAMGQVARAEMLPVHQTLERLQEANWGCGLTGPGKERRCQDGQDQVVNSLAHQDKCVLYLKVGKTTEIY
jgi:hypothetical protein